MEVPSQEINIALSSMSTEVNESAMNGIEIESEKPVYLQFIEDISPVEMGYILEGVIQAEDNEGNIEVRIPNIFDTQVSVDIPGEIPFTVFSPFKGWGQGATAECLIVRSYPVKMTDMGDKQTEFCVNTANAQFPMSKIFITEVNSEKVIAIQNAIAITGGVTQENIEARIHAHRRASLMLRTHCNKIAQRMSSAH